jgi:hypothetical protein
MAPFVEHPCIRKLKNHHGRVQLIGRPVPPGIIYVGRYQFLGGGPITDGVHWGNPFRLPSEIAVRARRYRGFATQKGKDEYWALNPYFEDAFRQFVWLLACEPEIQQRVKKELKPIFDSLKN